MKTRILPNHTLRSLSLFALAFASSVTALGGCDPNDPLEADELELVADDDEELDLADIEASEELSPANSPRISFPPFPNEHVYDCDGQSGQVEWEAEITYDWTHFYPGIPLIRGDEHHQSLTDDFSDTGKVTLAKPKQCANKPAWTCWEYTHNGYNVQCELQVRNDLRRLEFRQCSNGATQSCFQPSICGNGVCEVGEPALCAADCGT